MAIYADTLGDYFGWTTNLPPISTNLTICCRFTPMATLTTGNIFQVSTNLGPYLICWYDSSTSTVEWETGNGPTHGTLLTNVPAEKECFLAMTCDGDTAGSLLFYGNYTGLPLVVNSASGQSFTPTDLTLLDDQFAELARGRARSVIVYDEVLTAAELEQQSRQDYPLAGKSVWYWLPCLGGSISEALKDYSGNGYDATQTGSLTYYESAPTKLDVSQQSAAVGSTATFTAPTLTGATYQWQSAPISSLYHNVPGTWADISGATSATYTTGTLTSSDNGLWFRVVITISSDSMTSEAARLFITGLGPTEKGSIEAPALTGWLAKRKTKQPGSSRLLRDYQEKRDSTQAGTTIWNDWLFETAVSSITGTLATSTTLSSVSFSGSILTTGTLASTVGISAVSLTGTVSAVGTLSTTLAGGTFALTGVTGPTGSIATTLAGSTFAYTGEVISSGTLGPSVSLGTIALTGTVTSNGSIAFTSELGGVAITGTVSSGAGGSISISLDSASSDFVGLITVPGSISSVLESITPALSGSINVVAALASTLSDMVPAFSGNVAGATVTGTISVTLDGIIVSITDFVPEQYYHVIYKQPGTLSPYTPETVVDPRSII